MVIMMMRIGQKHGHKPIVLMGGATTKIGDPTGKDKSRPVITDEQVNNNIAGIQQVFNKFLSFGDTASGAILLNNDDWLQKMGYMELLRDYGRHFTINRMLAFESVKQRLEREQPMTFLEFNYMILQAYDFLELNRKYDCVLEMGGSDQWGNIINGVELVRRLETKPAYGLTCPLITTGSGKKMGKTEDGAVWMNADMLSPYDYWQYWRNTEDADVTRFMKYFTDLSPAEIDIYQGVDGAELNRLKILLADEATKMAHGEDCLKDIHNTIAQMFGGQDLDVEVKGKDDAGNALLKSALPIIQIPMKDIQAGVSAYLLVAQSGLVASNGEARRMIRGGGCKINDQKIEDENAIYNDSVIQDPGIIKISVGKKKHALIQPVK
jgi:tyrosyl-tRNA synthetase